MISDTHRAAALAVLLTTGPRMKLRQDSATRGVYDHLVQAGLVVHVGPPRGWTVTEEGEQWLRELVS